MNKKIETLRQSINDNPNLSMEFKCNVATLTDLLVTTLPQYDYSYLEEILSSIKISKNDKIIGYASYNKESNQLFIDPKKAFDDRIDLQHLFMKKLLSIGTHKEEKPNSLRGFYDGMSEAMTLLVLGDTGVKKQDVLEYHSISLLSKIVDPKILIDAYMTDNITLILENISSYGISDTDFRMLLQDINNISNDMVEENQSFATAQKRMIYMYGTKLETQIKNGTVKEEEIDESFNEFDQNVIHNREELLSVYSGYTFRGVEDLKFNRTHINNTKKRLKENINNEKAPNTEILVK